MGKSMKIGGRGRRPKTSLPAELTLPFLASDSILPPEPVSAPKPVPTSDSEPPQPPRRIPRWLERAELFLRVLLRMYLGLAVCYVPWSRGLWDKNPLFAHFPELWPYASNGAVRGLVSGLGLLNLWIAFYEALHHRDKYE
jgi:hypothetical protein